MSNLFTHALSDSLPRNHSVALFIALRWSAELLVGTLPPLSSLVRSICSISRRRSIASSVMCAAKAAGFDQQTASVT
jgi:hypothetical protein